MVQTDESSISYAGNNSIVVPYPVPFKFFTDGDLVVVVKDDAGVEDVQVLDTDYTVTGEGDPNGGDLVMTWAVPVTSTVSIFRDIPATQLTSYEEGDAFPAKSHERALDKLTMLVQQALRVTGGETNLGSAFRLTEASGGINAIAKLNDSTLCIDAFGTAILRTSGEMIGWLGMVGTAWEDTSARLVTQPTYIGQLGFQRDIKAIFYAPSMIAGSWAPYFPGEGIVVSNAEGAPSIILRPDGDIVGTLEAQNLFNKTLDHPSIIAPTGITKADVGLGNVDNTSDASKPLSVPQAAALTAKQNISEKGVNNGYPSLDSSGKIPVTQIPESVLGASQYQGTWNAATNSPTIPPAALGNKGWYFSVSVAGTTNINGISSWAVGDQIISNGTVWEKIPNVSAVNSVNGKTGVVVVNKADVGLSNVDNTSDATKDAAATTLTNKTIHGANNTLTVRLENDVTGNLPVARLNAGTGATPATWWCGDGTWKQPVGAGDVVGPPIAADNEIALFSGATGKLIKSSSRQIGNVVDGPASAVADHIPQFNGTTGKLLKDGKAAPAGEIVGTTDPQTISGKTLTDPVVGHAGILYRAGGIMLVNSALITATGTPEAVVWTYNLPANFLARDGDTLRFLIFHTINSIATNKRIRLRANGVIFYDQLTTAGAAISYCHDVRLVRMSQATQLMTASRTQDNAAAFAEWAGNLTFDLSTALTIDLSMITNGSATVTHRHSTMAFEPAP